VTLIWVVVAIVGCILARFLDDPALYRSERENTALVAIGSNWRFVLFCCRSCVVLFALPVFFFF
jgi:hypothetical protein